MMRTLKLLTTAFILIFSLNSLADERPFKGRKIANLSALVPKAPVVIGNPNEDAPAELKLLLATPAKVPVAPVVIGNPLDEAPQELKYLLANSTQVPVAPVVWGSPDEAPKDLQHIAAYPEN